MQSFLCRLLSVNTAQTGVYSPYSMEVSAPEIDLRLVGGARYQLVFLL